MAIQFTRLLRLTGRTAPLPSRKVQWQRLRYPTLSRKHYVTSPPNREVNPERFYEYYLEEAKVAPKGVQAGAWLHTRDAEAAMEALEPRFREDPLSALDSATCDIDIAGRSLEAFTVRAHAQTTSRAEVREILMREKPGTRALHWLLHSGAHQTVDLTLEPRFMNFIIHCLIAEKGNDRVMIWLQSATPKHLAHLPLKQSNAWKGIMLMLLVEHNVFWSNNDMNSAFMPLLKVFLWNEGPPQKPIDQHIPLQQGIIWTLQQLRYSTNASVDPKQYDRFIALYKRLWSNSEPHLFALDLAHLALFHPSTPRADPALQHIKSWPDIPAEASYHERYLKPKTRPVAHYMFVFIVRTARMLADQGRITDARQALDIAKTQMPELFQMRDTGAFNFRGDESFNGPQYQGKPDASNQRAKAVLTARQHQGSFW